MKVFSLISVVVLMSCNFALAGRLDFAVVQFPTHLEQSAVQEALEGESLADVIVGDRLQTRNGLIRGGLVIFAQTTYAGSNLTNITRMGNQEASVQGAIRGQTIQIEVSLAEGVEAPLKRFSRRVHSGSGPLRSGSPQVLGFRQFETRIPNVVKGKSKTVTILQTVALIYQYRP